MTLVIGFALLSFLLAVETAKTVIDAKSGVAIEEKGR
jgi:hypothetical protein